MLQIVILGGLGLLAMLSEVFNFKRIMPYVAVLGVMSAIVSSLVFWNEDSLYFNEMYLEDTFSKSFVLLSSTVFLLWMLVFRTFFSDSKHSVEVITLTCFALVGGFMMLGFSHLVMLFLGIEILSIPVYVLAGFNKDSFKSNEASFKYFIMGAFASCILLLGIVFIYGATGTFDLNSIATKLSTLGVEGLPVFYYLGILLVLMSMLFKISAVPFHFWTPDVYQGALIAITGLMSTVVKIFAIAACFKLYNVLLGESLGTSNWIIFLIIALTLIIGNSIGAIQDNPKRVLAYSSIGHTGFMLLSIFVGGDLGCRSLLYYGVAYSLSSILAFYVLSFVYNDNQTEEPTFDILKNLAKRNPLLGIGLTVSVLSMAGLPPFAGFFAKYFVISAAYDKGYYLLVVLAILTTLISVYYYLKFAIAIYGARDTSNSESIEISFVSKVVVLLMILFLVLVGVFPDYITSFIL
jgi:NADH-quinone oxidoreductase subunit N